MSDMWNEEEKAEFLKPDPEVLTQDQQMNQMFYRDRMYRRLMSESRRAASEGRNLDAWLARLEAGNFVA
jgi:hypothetical protein